MSLFDGLEAHVYYMRGHGWEDVRIRKEPFIISELQNLARAGLLIAYAKKLPEVSLDECIKSLLQKDVRL